jgi:hypothetical protein
VVRVPMSSSLLLHCTHSRATKHYTQKIDLVRHGLGILRVLQPADILTYIVTNLPRHLTDRRDKPVKPSFVHSGSSLHLALFRR